MGESEGVLLVVPGLDLGFGLLEESESEVVLLVGSIAESLILHMGMEFLVELVSGLLVVSSKTEDGACFPEVHFCKKSLF